MHGLFRLLISFHLDNFRRAIKRLAYVKVLAIPGSRTSTASVSPQSPFLLPRQYRTDGKDPECSAFPRIVSSLITSDGES
ncbi:uncharacterized protein LOC141749082 isoform X2 [Larus michahellis]|uniref:uncharacterized protein LOC141749082 isoform X2 n=1 Tax=Larus michahellis TaxID=119627 RepID=UPI003D9B335B